MKRLVSYISSRLTREYWADYFNKANFVNGIKTCRFKYKIPVLLLLLSSITGLITIPNVAINVICVIFILLTAISLATVEI